ncbi:hypothetical protein OWV82_023797 [Melia azedarach]|uniref:Uncharacterized protein n=1 Tax=Melia azedarach TaxID=155640 RepID=A0ACC1WXU1_MELAZ|nr:hypothetical protein OWV82_023797 [Melia azedarach]
MKKGLSFSSPCYYAAVFFFFFSVRRRLHLLLMSPPRHLIFFFLSLHAFRIWKFQLFVQDFRHFGFVKLYGILGEVATDVEKSKVVGVIFNGQTK